MSSPQNITTNNFSFFHSRFLTVLIFYTETRRSPPCLPLIKRAHGGDLPPPLSSCFVFVFFLFLSSVLFSLFTAFSYFLSIVFCLHILSSFFFRRILVSCRFFFFLFIVFFFFLIFLFFDFFLSSCCCFVFSSSYFSSFFSSFSFYHSFFLLSSFSSLLQLLFPHILACLPASYFVFVFSFVLSSSLVFVFFFILFTSHLYKKRGGGGRQELKGRRTEQISHPVKKKVTLKKLKKKRNWTGEGQDSPLKKKKVENKIAAGNDSQVSRRASFWGSGNR